MANLGLQNQNPGNLRDPSTGNFKVFNNSNEGYQALTSDIDYKKSGQSPHIKPGGSILDLANVWAPASDNNKPSDWANNVAKTVGVDASSPWADIPTDKLAHGIQVAEGTDSMKGVSTSQNQGGGMIQNMFGVPTANAQTTDQPQSGSPYSSEVLSGSPSSQVGMSIEEKKRRVEAMIQQGAQPKVIQEYLDSLKGSGGGSQTNSQGYITQATVPQGNNKTPITPGSEEPSLVSQLGGRAKTASSALSDLGDQLSGKPGSQNWWSDLLHVGGSVAGGIGDLINAGVNLIPGVKGAEDWVGGQIGKLADTKIGQSVVSSIKEFQQSHPEMAQDIGDIGNIATLIPMFKGIGIVTDSVLGNTLKNVAVNGVKRTLEDVTGETVDKALVKTILENDLLDVGKSKVGSSAGKTILKVAPDYNIESATFGKNAEAVDKLLKAVDGKPYSYGKVMNTVEKNAVNAGAGIGYGMTGGMAGGAEGYLGGWLAKKGVKGVANKLIKSGIKTATEGRPGLIKSVLGAGMTGASTIPSRTSR